MANVALASLALPSVSSCRIQLCNHSPHKPKDLGFRGAAWQVMGITWTHRQYLLFMVGADHLRACGTGHTKTNFTVQRRFLCPRRTDRRWGHWREEERGKEEGEDMFVPEGQRTAPWMEWKQTWPLGKWWFIKGKKTETQHQDGLFCFDWACLQGSQERAIDC